MTKERLENITCMENILNKAAPFFEEAAQFLHRWEQLSSEIKCLEEYYYSEQWKKDFDASNCGEIPVGTPHGVLSEDLIYNVLGDQQSTALAFLKQVTKILAGDEKKPADKTEIDLLKKRLIDKDNKIIRWPRKQQEQNLILQYIRNKFDADIFYSEIEVNTIIKNSITFDDYALIRRELIEKHYLDRSGDCKKYWVKII